MVFTYFVVAGFPCVAYIQNGDDDANADAELHSFFQYRLQRKLRRSPCKQRALPTAHHGRQAVQHYQLFKGCAALGIIAPS